MNEQEKIVSLVASENYGKGYPGYHRRYRIEAEDGWAEVRGPNVNGPTWNYSIPMPAFLSDFATPAELYRWARREHEKGGE